MAREARPRMVFAGSGPFALPALQSLAGRYPVVAIVTQPDRPAGRGRTPDRGLIAAAADERDIEVLQPERLRQSATVDHIASLAPDVLIVASYGRILPQALLDVPTRGSLNLHPSLLPRHRGPSPVAAAILQGDEKTGVTVMEMVAAMDAGPIVAQRESSIDRCDTTGSLTERLAMENAALLMECLPAWLEEKIQARPQDEAEATYTSLLTKEAARIDWNMPAMVLEREVRAYAPWPVAFTAWHGGSLRIYGARVGEAGPSDVAPGRVLSAGPEGIAVATGEGTLVLREVQGAGGKRMAAAEYARGHPEIREAVLGA